MNLFELLPLPYVEAVVVVGSGLIGAVAGMLGPWSVLARRSLIGDLLSHGMLPGVVVAYAVTGSLSTLVLTIGGIAGAVLAASAALLIERSGRTPADAALGVALAGALSAGLVLLASVQRAGGTAGLDGFLFGQAAALRTSDVLLAFSVAVAALVMIMVAWRPLHVAALDPAFGRAHGQPRWLADVVVTIATLAAVVVGVRAVGVILMVALLVAPAVFARRLTRRLAPLLAVATGTGALLSSVGAWASARLSVPTGAGVTVLVCAVALVAVALPAGRGRRVGGGAPSVVGNGRTGMRADRRGSAGRR